MSVIEADPAEKPEDTTTTDPQVGEETAESPEGSEAGEGSETSEEQQETTKEVETAEEFELLIDGQESRPDPDEEPPKDGKAWAKARAAERELKAKVARLEAEALARVQPPASTDPGPEPDIEDDDVAWDQAKLKAKHATWLKAKEAHDAEKAKAAQKATAQTAKWEETKSAIVKSRDELIKSMPGYEAAESVADSRLGPLRIGDGPQAVPALVILARVCKAKTPLVMAALGSDPARLNDLAATDDILEFVGKIKELEGKVKTQKKGNTPPPPEQKIRGGGAASGAVDAREDQLLDQAMKSGNVDALRAQRKSRKK